MANHRIADQLLETSVSFATSRRAFELAVRAAREAGWSDDEITRVTGISRYQIADATTHLRAA